MISSNGSLPSLFFNATQTPVEIDQKSSGKLLGTLKTKKSADTSSISSDFGSLDDDSLRKSKRKGFFSFARKKDKQIN